MNSNRRSLVLQTRDATTDFVEYTRLERLILVAFPLPSWRLFGSASGGRVGILEVMLAVFFVWDAKERTSDYGFGQGGSCVRRNKVP
jgi:hypothetical protein